MAHDGNARIEALEHQLMRNWLAGDRKAVKGLLSSRFRLVLGAKPPVLLDRKSMVEAAGEAWRLTGYRFGTSVYARPLGSSALFATEVELQGEIDGTELTGAWWMSDSWQRSTMTRNWQLADRQLTRLDDSAVPEAMRRLQLWR